MYRFYWIVIANFALYFRTLRFKFVSDDLQVYQKQLQTPPVFKSWFHKRWSQFIGASKFMDESYRFMKVEGKWKWAHAPTEEREHLAALLLHTVICCLIYIAFGSCTVSFVAALLYGANPVNNQGTIWPGGRGYALPIIMILISLSWPWASIVAIPFCNWFTVGFLSTLCLVGSTKWWLSGVVVLGWAINARKFVKAVKLKHGNESFHEDKLSFHPRKFVLAIKTFGFYTLLCLVPFKITFYHSFLQSCAGSLKHKAYNLCKFFWIGTAILTAEIWYWTHTPWNTISWALLAWTITIAPFCNFVRANQEIAERFAALPNVFLMYALAQILSPYEVYDYAITAILAFYATRTFYTLTMYKDEYWITECAVVEDPKAWFAWHVRALKRWGSQSYQEALTLWVMAKMISPKEFKLLMNIAACLRAIGNHKESDHFLKLAKENIVAGQEEISIEAINSHKKGQAPIII